MPLQQVIHELNLSASFHAVQRRKSYANAVFSVDCDSGDRGNVSR